MLRRPAKVSMQWSSRLFQFQAFFAWDGLVHAKRPIHCSQFDFAVKYPIILVDNYLTMHFSSIYTRKALSPGSWRMSCFLSYKKVLFKMHQLRRYFFPFLPSFSPPPNFFLSSVVLWPSSFLLQPVCDPSLKCNPLRIGPRKTTRLLSDTVDSTH